MPIRVLIVDDHGVVRQGLRMYLASQPDIEVVGDGRNGQEAIDLARELEPNVVLMDLLMPVMDGIAATAQIRRELPETEVVAMTSVLEDTAAAQAVKAGAIGYVLKDPESQELVAAINAAAAGRVYLTPAARSRLMREVGAPRTPLELLAPPELEILKLIAEGRSNREIALLLSTTDQIVKSHVDHVLDKLGVSSRTQAALHAIKFGLTGQ